MNFLKMLLILLISYLVVLPKVAIADDIIFFDDFNDNIIDTTKWTTVGNRVVEENSMLKLQQLTTDNGGAILSSPININNQNILTISTRSYLHYSNNYYYPRLDISFGASMSNDIQNFGVTYKNYNGSYIPPDYREDPMHGFYIYKDSDTATSSNIAQNFSVGTTTVLNQWFNEKFIYNPITGFAQYYINDEFRIQYFVGKLTDPTQMTLFINTYGWFTGHYRYVDDITVSQSYGVNIDIPKPTATPDLSYFPKTPNLFVDSDSFIKQTSTSFSTPSQVFLDGNLNTLEKFLVKHTSGQGWKTAFIYGEEFSKFIGTSSSILGVGYSYLFESPLAGIAALGNLAGKEIFYRSLDLKKDYNARLFINSTILQTKASGLTPVSLLFSANSIIWGDWLAGELSKLANDPPDTNYTEVFQSQSADTSPFNFSGVSPETNRLLGLAFGSLYNTYYSMEGLTTSINRYGSALEAGDVISAGLQFEAFLTYLTQYDAQVMLTADYLKQLRQEMIDQSMPDWTYNKQDLLNLQNLVQLNGLPQELIDFYKDLGLTDSDLSALVQAMLNFTPPDNMSATLFSTLEDSANLLLYESSASAVPIPHSIFLLGTGLLGLAGWRQFRRG